MSNIFAYEITQVNHLYLFGVKWSANDKITTYLVSAHSISDAETILRRQFPHSNLYIERIDQVDNTVYPNRHF